MLCFSPQVFFLPTFWSVESREVSSASLCHRRSLSQFENYIDLIIDPNFFWIFVDAHNSLLLIAYHDQRARRNLVRIDLEVDFTSLTKRFFFFVQEERLSRFRTNGNTFSDSKRVSALNRSHQPVVAVLGCTSTPRGIPPRHHLSFDFPQPSLILRLNLLSKWFVPFSPSQETL